VLGIRIRIKMSRIPNTDLNWNNYFYERDSPGITHKKGKNGKDSIKPIKNFCLKL
jgi:hypothetical protein